MIRHFARYIAVGVVSTAIHYLLLVVVVEFFGWAAYLGSGCGAVVGAQVAYVGNRSFTFAHRGEMSASWPRFQATALFATLLGMAIVGVGVRFGLHYLAAQLVATLTSLVLTFTINRHWTFRAPSTRDRA